MLGDIRKVEHIYIACGYTDLRRGIDGLAQIVQNQFSLDPCSSFAAEDGTGLKPCFGKEMDMYYFTSV